MAAVPGSLFRKTLFWAHLSCGVAAGILILIMSATGVLLAYERQIMQSQSASNRVTLETDAVPATVDRLAEAARTAAPSGARLSLVFDVDPAMPVTASMGREGQLLLHPVTAEVLPDAADGARHFFEVVENWHRRLAGESRSTRASLMDIANLLFLFIIASGIYLWLPAVWRWRTLRGLMLFQSKYINSKVRDFNWHHVFSFWMLIPLFLIALSGVVISYPWASNLVYAAYGETPPPRGGGGGGGGGPGAPGGVGAGGAARVEQVRGEQGGLVASAATAAPAASLDSLVGAARTQFSDWRRITLPLDATGPTVQLTAELNSTQLRAPRQTLTLSASDASVIELAPPPAGPAAQSPGQRARVWLRFVHTGEQYGLTGQTLAAIASLAACFLAYTGLALAWRRLIVPLYRRTV